MELPSRAFVLATLRYPVWFRRADLGEYDQALQMAWYGVRPRSVLSRLASRKAATRIECAGRPALRTDEPGASEEAVIAQERVADLTALLRSCAPISGAVILSNGDGALLLSTYAVVSIFELQRLLPFREHELHHS